MAEKTIHEIGDYSEKQSLSLEYIKIEKWLKKLRFRKKLFGGVSEQDVWKKIGELNEMFPAVKDGDLIIGFRLQQSYTKNDVVIYGAKGKRHIGRIAARESDVVAIDDSGTFLVNGTTQGGEILYPTYAKEGIDYPYQVPKEHIFILGDYRTQTQDSRDFGSISLSDVEGKVITILRRRGL
ncbi:MAG: signal peptidase I [Clostridiaceae bacterium]|nr:signal peptidase I [Clostridiaceae bacterium]